MKTPYSKHVVVLGSPLPALCVANTPAFKATAMCTITAEDLVEDDARYQTAVDSIVKTEDAFAVQSLLGHITALENRPSCVVGKPYASRTLFLALIASIPPTQVTDYPYRTAQTESKKRKKAFHPMNMDNGIPHRKGKHR